MLCINCGTRYASFSKEWFTIKKGYDNNISIVAKYSKSAVQRSKEFDSDEKGNCGCIDQ